MQLTHDEITRLSPDERLALIAQLWDSLDDHQVQLTPAQQDWYEAEAPGLGRRFRAEIDSVVRRLADNPRQFTTVFKTLRRARAKKFPYALFFLVEPDVLLVV